MRDLGDVVERIRDVSEIELHKGQSPGYLRPPTEADLRLKTIALEKIVKRIGVGGCPKCRNRGFEYQEGSDPYDHEAAAVQCPNCGKGIMREVGIIPEPDAN